MNEYKLKVLLGQIVLAVLPLPAVAGCGGAASAETFEAGGSGGEAGGTGSGGSGATGGAGAGGSGATGGGAGFAGSGGQAGTTGTGGSSGGFGGFTGGAGGGAGTGQGGVGGANCQGEPYDCFTYRTVQVDRECLPADTQTLSPELCTFVCNVLPGCPCGEGAMFCSMLTQQAETVSVTCSPICAIGRRPAAFIESVERGADLGAHFARAAELEALAVVAFRDLRAELAERGAPRRLLRALSSAARDEVRHARSTRRLSRRFGGAPVTPRALPREPRSLEAIALENIVEGCVREAYGALSALWQATTAKDPAVRGALRTIARDEIRHAALSMKVQRWLEPRLTPEARRRVAEARRAALSELRAELAIEPSADMVELAGYPDVAQAQRLVDELAERLWS